MTWIALIFIIISLAAFFYILFLRQKNIELGKNEMKKMEDRRSAFVSIISHQLRTPLSVIKGYLEALSTGDQGQLNPGQKEYLDDALKINLETIKLVNDYLEFVRLDSEHIPVKPESMDLAKMVEDEVKKMSLLARAYNCELNYQSLGKPLSPVMADPIKIRQVIQNIIANAIKYSSGRGQAKVFLEEETDFIIFHCKDAGVGIPADQQPDIFTKFFRAKNVINKDTKGSGLGLYLAKMIVTALGGKIWLESVENRGTTVSFSLPKYSSK